MQPIPVSRPSRPGLRLARIGGVDVQLDPSLLVVFVLVVVGVATSTLSFSHPGWSAGLRWGLAACAAVLFFASILIHELAHALVARAYEIEVPRITLFLFGGVSELRSEPESPASEFSIAIVGPLTSAAIGVGCAFASAALAGPAFVEAAEVDPRSAIALMSPVATLFAWLGSINLALAVFNLVPGFPLDGGRVLRAILWAITGDLVRATRWAALAGRVVAWLLIAWGLLRVLSGDFGGLWLALIGWFLSSAAARSVPDLLVRTTLDRLQVRDLMRTRFDPVDPDVSLVRFVDDQLLRGAQTAWPVVRDGRPIGLVTFDEVAAISPDQRSGLTVGDVMRPIEPLDPDERGREALDRIVGAEQEALPVIDGGRVVGLLHRADLMRWLAVHPT